jgi:hypothetical protein
VTRRHVEGNALANKIPHCGKSLPVENRYVVSNYPGPGDLTYFEYALCQQCRHPVHAFHYLYFRKSKPTETWISDKDDRHIFQDFIECGRAYMVASPLEEVPRNARAQVLACQWTLETTKPADSIAFYLAKNARAPWISNQAKESICHKRERWLAQYRARERQGL